jgi:hypothetical protein
MKSPLPNFFACLLLAGAGLSCRPAGAPDANRAEVRSSAVAAVAIVAGAESSEATLRAELQRRFRPLPEGGLTVEHKLDGPRFA